MKVNNQVKRSKLGTRWGKGHSVYLTVIFPVWYAVEPNCKWVSVRWSPSALSVRWVEIETGTAGTTIEELTLHSFCYLLDNLLSKFLRRHFIKVKINNPPAYISFVGEKKTPNPKQNNEHWERENAEMKVHREKDFETKCWLKIMKELFPAVSFPFFFVQGKRVSCTFFVNKAGLQ